MEIEEIFLNIIDKPNIPKFYKELLNYYIKHNMIEEANGIQYLIETKYDHQSSNHPE